MAKAKRSRAGKAVAVVAKGKRRTRPRPGEQTRPLDARELKQPAAALFNLLIRTAEERELANHELLAQLNITKAHFHLMRTGQRSAARLRDETIQKMADFVKLPRVVILLLAGRLTHDDFAIPPDGPAYDLGLLLQVVQRDPEFGGFITADVMASPPEVRLLIVKLYERARGLRLILAAGGTKEMLQLERQVRDRVHKSPSLGSLKANTD